MNILQEKRLAAVLSKQDLAELSGVDRKTITALERVPPSYTPRPKTVQKLAKALGIPPAHLAGLLLQEVPA